MSTHVDHRSPFDLANSRPLLGFNLSVPQGILVLKLSAMWQMDNLTSSVIEEMTDLQARRESWIDLLELANVHQLPDARKLAVEKITKTFNGRGTDKVVLGRQCRMKKWLEEGLRELVDRKDGFTDEDDETLGWKTVSKVYRIRERLHIEKCDRHFNDVKLQDGVKREFEMELNEIDYEI